MRIDALPSANEIDHPGIRQAAEKNASAQAALKVTQKQLRDEWRDTDAAKQALAAGRTSGTGSYGDHVKKLDKLERDLKAAQDAARDAHAELQSALDEHGAAWLDDLAAQAGELEQEWNEALTALASLHGQRTALNAQRARLGAETPAITNIRLKPSQLTDSLNGDKLAVAWNPDPQARNHLRALAPVGDILAALAELGVREELPTVLGVPGLGEAFKRAREHAATVGRGFAPGEHNAPLVREHYLAGDGRRVSVHVPSGGGDD